TGEVQVKPDIARVTLGVQNQGREASGVSQENAQKTAALIKAVKAAGVADKDIQTTGYSLYPQYDYSNGIAPDGRPLPVTSPPKISGYQASNTVTVTVRKIENAGKVIDAGIKAGGNAANGINFDVDNSTPSQDAALQKAVADAIRKAKVIAKATGATGLTLVGVQQADYQPPRPMFKAAMMSRTAEAVPTPVEAGESTITASVTVRFRMSSGAAGGGVPISLAGTQ
ncbi:MAG: SIMPL domain-containing protein, partial [Cytophagales bacterium]|nr:SIMPL domain-containing protein [Armatimonadota bacterium]